ncbi:helix-turn-helix transcriptional regulator [Clostridium sp. BNL1100]|uniref:helix-turn-helix domain-containing protein n=1 Tax=Clostridium sp. BNL1100 TaxID=755731 RepID=UPI00024A7AA4|nr:helix-turn-helix transcriptional regulator [Clostridium sp. BNL1100]AEY66620.1 putative transcriptional regulator [Clostridium sp. BNL1100]
MPISFKKLEMLLKSKGLNMYYLRKNGISPSIVDKLQKDEGNIDTRTITKVCEIIGCQPGDIMEYIPECDT